MTVILVTGWISIHWLDPRNLDKPSTVLGRLYRLSLKDTWHGAVMGSDIRVNDRARDFVIPSVSQAMHLFDDPQGPRPPKFSATR
jgi:hypothetical protein